MNAEQAIVRWRNAAGALGSGRTAEAVGELRELFDSRQALPPALQVDIAFTYAVSRLHRNRETRDPELAIAIFKELIETKGYGASGFLEGDSRKELGAAYLQLGRFQEAIVQLEIAIDSLQRNGGPLRIARINLGMARSEVGDYAGALSQFRLAIEESQRDKDIERYGAVCEHIGRVLIADGRATVAQPWLERARLVYQSFAPHRFSTFKDLATGTAGPFCELVPSPLLDEDDSQWLAYVRERIKSARLARLSVLDIDLYGMLLGSKSNETRFHATVPLGFDDETGNTIVGLLVEDLKTVWLSPSHLGVVSRTMLAKRLSVPEAKLPTVLPLIGSSVQSCQIGGAREKGMGFYWEAPAPWPMAFAIPIAELIRTFALSYRSAQGNAGSVRRAGYEPPGQIPIYGRSLPTRLLRRWWDLGGRATGLQVAPSSLSDNLIEPALRDRELNRARLQSIGYTDGEARDLDWGGVVGIPYSEVRGWVQNLGGLPVDEFNLANPPAVVGARREDVLGGYVIDTHYQTPFFARKVGDHALHGRNPRLLRDHFEEFNKAVEPVDYVRLKHFAAPVIEAETLDSLRQLVTLLRASRGCEHVYFRGQDRGWASRRTPIVQRLLHGAVGLCEPSLPGAATRHGVDYESLHSAMGVIVQDILYESCAARGGSMEELHEKWKALRMSPGWNWDSSVMAMGQHYGVPTDGIDITDDLDIAIWFAVNRFIDLKNGHARYESISPQAWPSEASEWPVVYLIAPVTNSMKPSVRSIVGLSECGLDLVRPTRQSAKFFMGAYGYHQNRLAETVAAIVRLAPGDWTTSHEYRSLFPGPETDPAYAGLLRAKHQHAGHGALGDLLAHVVEYV